MYNKRGFYNIVCKLAMMASGLLAIFGIVLVWIMYPKAYDYELVSRRQQAAVGVK